MQSRLILAKARKLKVQGTAEEKENAGLAEQLLQVTLENKSLAGRKTLDSGEYTVRANAMVEARRLVGGIEIEKV